MVVVEGRVFVRSWNDKPAGWYRAFRGEPRGSLQVGKQEIPIRARHTRSERLREAVTRAYARKYDTEASRKWVRGFAEDHRMATTLELKPGQPGLLTNPLAKHRMYLNLLRSARSGILGVLTSTPPVPSVASLASPGTYGVSLRQLVRSPG